VVPAETADIEEGRIGDPEPGCKAERVGFVAVVVSPINNLGPFSNAQTLACFIREGVDFGPSWC
jgi:hypothetical protein